VSNEKKPLSLNDAVALLDLLTSNEAFREAFQLDPAGALSQISADAAESAKGCMMAGPLAPSGALASSRDRLLEQFTSKGMFTVPHCFIEGEQ